LIGCADQRTELGIDDAHFGKQSIADIRRYERIMQRYSSGTEACFCRGLGQAKGSLVDLVISWVGPDIPYIVLAVGCILIC